ncbi:hypothetical protein HNQ07_002450 [Deinococcus metalli]|uniref:Uncharacterized protein n=1 Tax=Deinococcus metalli TaxID=1141878 RepID=A0A7W8NPN8_9DEIO|nr:hypothetical protein [Deinococcus metalli]MBB5376986.1 hypothetical protein [Deinococcus metalli]GHF46838.1 hypothetical protein GCM10017781_24140 [Deinococcus metalli]
MDDALRKTLSILNDNWFRYESLCPRAMWLVELHHGVVESGEDAYSWPLRAFFVDHCGHTDRSVFEWRRFYVSQWQPIWHVGQDPPRRAGHRPDVYEIGLASFTRTLDTGVLTVEMMFGPLYGRGCELSATGECTTVWVS